MTAAPQQGGFSLIELAMALFIVALLMGTLLSPLSGAFEERRRQSTRAQLKEINQALLGFAAVRGRLPCPASAQSHGQEAFIGDGNPLTGGDCQVQHGFVPAATLSLTSPLNSDGLLLDAWHNPYRYSVDQSNVDGSGQSTADFTTTGDMAAVGMPNLSPQLLVCTRAASNQNCSDNGGTLRANHLVAVTLSMGADWATYSSLDQRANAGGASLNSATRSYPMANNRYFVSASYTQSNDDQHFDDLVIWLSDNLLYTHLLKAGQLP